MKPKHTALALVFFYAPTLPLHPQTCDSSIHLCGPPVQAPPDDTPWQGFQYADGATGTSAPSQAPRGAAGYSGTVATIELRFPSLPIAAG
jgi:hypothetical protein